MLAAAMLEGLPPNNAAQLLRFSCDEAGARAASDIVVEVFDPAGIAAAATKACRVASMKKAIA